MCDMEGLIVSSLFSLLLALGVLLHFIVFLFIVSFFFFLVGGHCKEAMSAGSGSQPCVQSA